MTNISGHHHGSLGPAQSKISTFFVVALKESYSRLGKNSFTGIKYKYSKKFVQKMNEISL